MSSSRLARGTTKDRPATLYTIHLSDNQGVEEAPQRGEANDCHRPFIKILAGESNTSAMAALSLLTIKKVTTITLTHSTSIVPSLIHYIS